jgi:CBS domain-containing protein
MRKNDPISNIMAKKVESVQQGQPLSEAYKLMCNTGVHHIPVLDGKKLTGLISFTDMMKLDLAIGGVNGHSVDAIMDQQFSTVGVMSTDLTTLSEGQTVRDAARLLGDGDFHSLPVIDKNQHLAGIVTSTDLIRYLSDQY